MQEPKNHTSVLINGEHDERFDNVYYRLYPDWAKMPHICQTEEVYNEWRAWWDWYEIQSSPHRLSGATITSVKDHALVIVLTCKKGDRTFEVVIENKWCIRDIDD